MEMVLPDGGKGDQEVKVKERTGSYLDKIKRKNLRFLWIGPALCILGLLIWLLYRYNFIPHKK